MHYIRFLKPPQVTAGVLSAKLTITTDLGDDFLAADLPLQLVIQHSSTYTTLGDSRTNPNIVQWKKGSRELCISIPLPRKEGIPKERDGGWQLLVWPCLTRGRGGEERVSGKVKYKKGKPTTRAPEPSFSTTDSILNIGDVLKINRGDSQKHTGVKGLVLAAQSAMFSLGTPAQKLPASVERCFGMGWRGRGEKEGGVRLRIEEETGESIARHVWDAGVIFSALLREMCVIPDAKNTPPTYLKELRRLLQSGRGEDVDGSSADGEDDEHDIPTEYPSALNVLELGTGCAIVSATLFHCLPHARIIATDMPEAREIASRNLSRNRTEEIGRGDLKSADSGFEVLDWTMPLPGAKGIDTRRWDLVLVADCTYNADVVPALVETLRRLVDESPEVLIVVALKWRHDSEKVFFELMRERGMREVGRHTERCGKFDEDATGKEEEIEIYLFKGGESRAENESKGNPMENEGGKKRKLSDGKEDGVAKK